MVWLVGWLVEKNEAQTNEDKANNHEVIDNDKATDALSAPDDMSSGYSRHLWSRTDDSTFTLPWTTVLRRRTETLCHVLCAMCSRHGLCVYRYGAKHATHTHTYHHQRSDCSLAPRAV